MIIRSAQTKDFSRVNNLYEYVDKLHRDAHKNRFKKPEIIGRNKHHLESLISEWDSQLIVAEENGEIIGFAEAYVYSSPNVSILKEREYLLIDTIAVDKNHKRCGAGQALLDYLVKWAKELGINEIELRVFSFNESAIKFYEKNGFKELSRTMKKDL